MPVNFCQLCGRVLKGAGKSYHHPQWPKGQSLRVCADCERDKPRCKACSLPMAAATANGLCVTCQGTARLCLACGRAVSGRAFQVEGREPYCEACMQERRPCDVCGAPLTDEHWQLSDGRVTCAHCHASAIYTPGEAKRLYEGMKAVIASNLGLALNIPTGLALVDRVQLAEIIRQQGNGRLEIDPERTLGIYARKGIRRGIYVQSGLPRCLLLQIAAHEYAHAWQGENCPLLREPLVLEGFAEWMAYKVLGYYGLSGQQARIKARADLYGQGLNWALNVEAKQGVRGLIEACQNTR